MLAFHVASARGQVSSYECDVFPESASAPWTTITDGTPQRWIDNGLFCQLVSGQFDGYKRFISEFTGSPSFFVTWREFTDSPRSAMPDVPNGISVWSSASFTLFSFDVTADQVRLLRGDAGGGGSVFLVDVQGSAFHTYYLAIHSDLSYSWYIDGAVVNSGQYPDHFPDASSAIQWWAESYIPDPPQTAKWAYVRYGVIPADHSGDFNNNGVADINDVYYFVDCLLSPDYDAAGPGCRWADMNADGKADGADIQLFVNAMTGS